MRAGARDRPAAVWSEVFSERCRSNSGGVGRQVASSHVYRMPALWRPTRRFLSGSAPHSSTGATPCGARLALRWTCQSSAVVQSGRASRERARHRWRERSCADPASRAANRRSVRAAGAASAPPSGSGARRLPRRDKWAPCRPEFPVYQEEFSRFLRMVENTGRVPVKVCTPVSRFHP